MHDRYWFEGNYLAGHDSVSFGIILLTLRRGSNFFFFIFPMIYHYVTNGIRDIMSPVSFHSHKNGSLKINLLTKLFQEAEDSERDIFGTDTKGVMDLVEWKLFGRKRVLPV
jgi:hypothetical protein